MMEFVATSLLIDARMHTHDAADPIKQLKVTKLTTGIH